MLLCSGGFIHKNHSRNKSKLNAGVVGFFIDVLIFISGPHHIAFRSSSYKHEEIPSES